MAEIIVTTTPVNLNVSTTQSNITVTDVETNVTVNVASLSSNITVSSEPVNVVIAPSIGVSNSEVRAALGNTNPILYDVNSGVFSFDADAAFNNAKVIGAIQSGNVTLKQVQETYFNLGNTSTTTLSINIANGTIQRTLLQSNVNQINFANLSPGGGVTVFLEQDAFGFRLLDTSTNFNNWLFVDDFKTLSVGAGNVDSLSVIYDGTTYYASLTRLNSADIDATFDNITVNYNTISNVLTANTVTVTNGLTSTANSNFVGAVTLGNNLNVAGQLFADGNQIYIGQPSTATNKIINAYSSATAGQIYYGGADSTWYFRNNTAGGATFKIPTSTTDLTEGANLYFSTSRANSAIQDYKGTISTTGSITTTANIQGNFFIGNGSLLSGITSTSNAQLVSYIATVPLTVGGNLTVNGNINATGNINVQNVEDLYVRDQTIVMNANAASPANVQIVSNRPGFANVELKWNEQTDRWTFTNDGTTYFPIPTSTTDLVEGANLYYTTARANSAIGAYQGNINTAGTLTAGATEINGNLTIDPSTGNAIITGQSTTDDLSMYFENIDLRIGSAFDEGRLFVRDNVSSNVLMSISAAEVDNYTTRLRGDVIIGVDPNTSNTFGQFVFDVTQGDLDVAGGLEAETLFGNSAISSINGNIFTTNGNIYTTSGNVSGAYIKGNGSELTGLSTTQVSEGTNLYFTDARVRGNVSATTATGITYDSGTGVFSLASIPNSSLSNSTVTINGKTVALGGSNTLTTSDIAEGTNLYFTTDRANNNSNAWLTTKTTTDLAEGTNLYYTTDRANTAIGAYQGNISTPGNITAGNVITTNIYTNGTSLTLNANSNVVIRETIKGVSTNVGNISGDGYGFFSNPGLGGNVFFVQNVNAGNLDSYYFTTGNTTANSNIVTGVSIALIRAGAANVSANLNLVTPYYAIGPFGAEVQDPFPAGTYVTSVDAANSTITLNNPAAASRDLSVAGSAGGAPYNRGALVPGAFDANTGFLIGLVSHFTAGFSALSRTQIAGQFFARQGAYGYPVTGPAPTDFVYAIGNSSNYSQGNVPAVNFYARTNFEGPRTVFAAPRGLVVGNGDLTSRAENDNGSTFGINVLWDGLTTGATPSTQLLLKQYSDNSFASGSPTSGGPRIFFTAARGNKNQSYLATYPRNNDEMGRLIWWGPTQFLPGTSTVNPPAWISGVAGQDFVDTNSGMGMYFANSPNTTRFDRSLYLASTKGATLIASAADSSNTHQPVIFAPSHLIPTGGNNGNSVFLYNQTVSGTETAIDDFAPSGAHFAQINYANTTGLTGAKVSVTNGNNFATQHEGNIVLSLDRNSNTANVRVGARIGFVNYLGSSNPDRVRFDFAPEGLANAAPVTISGFTNATVAGALNGNVFYVKGPFINGSFREYELYTDSGLTTGVNLGVTNVNAGPGTFTYTRTNSVTAKEWTLVLAQGSNNLVLAEDGVTSTTFASGGNINLATNATINYDAVYGCFHNMSNVTAAAADTVYAFAWPNVHINTNRVTVASNSQITIGQEGAYIFTLEMQAENTSNQDRNAFIWLAKNGTDINETCVRVSLLKEGNQVITKEWIVAGINANDYIEVRFAVDNATNVQLTAIPAQASPYLRPAVPSAVITVTPVGV